MNSNSRFGLIVESWTRFWQTYITWFTWHFAIHMTILAGYFSLDAIQDRAASAALFIMIFAALGLGANACMVWYGCQTRKLAQRLAPGYVTEVTLGGALSRYAGWATLITGVLLNVMWLKIWLDALAIRHQSDVSCDLMLGMCPSG